MLRSVPARRLLALFGVIVLFTSAVIGQWRRVESGSLAWLHAIYFVDEKTGWIGGSNGTLLRTSDGGRTWEKSQFKGTDSIRDIAFIRGSEGWMLCEQSPFGGGKRSNRSYLMHTTDGGNNWSRFDFKFTSEPRTAIFFDKKGEGYAVGEGGVIAGFSRDGVADKKTEISLRYLILDGVALNNSRMLLVGGGASIIWTDDDGRSWNRSKFDLPQPMTKLNAVTFINDRRGWAVGNEGVIVSSVDGGKSWRTEVSNTSTNLTDILFNDAKNGFASGENGIILRSVDGGTSWTPETTGSKHRLERLAKAGDNVVAVGFGGTILIREIDSRQKEH